LFYSVFCILYSEKSLLLSQKVTTFFETKLWDLFSHFTGDPDLLAAVTALLTIQTHRPGAVGGPVD